MANTRIVCGRYKFNIKPFARGAYGSIYLAEDKEYPDERFALKEINALGIDTKEAFTIAKEATLLASLNHNNILKFHDSFLDNDFFYIVTQYCSTGNLEEYISSQKEIEKFSEEKKILKWLFESAQAVNYLHEKRICHRDIKPLNIFLYNNTLKLGDFGISISINGTLRVLTSFGTLLYRSPELYDRKTYDAKCDVWALGTSWYQMCLYKMPFETELEVLNSSYKDLPKAFSKDLNEIIKNMLQKDPSKRYDSSRTLQEIRKIYSDVKPNPETKETSINENQMSEKRIRKLEATNKELTGTKETLEERNKELHEANKILKKNVEYIEEKNADLNQKNHELWDQITKLENVQKQLVAKPNVRRRENEKENYAEIINFTKRYCCRYKIKQPNNFDFYTTTENQTEIKSWLQRKFTNTDLTNLLKTLEEKRIPPALNNNILKNNILKKYKLQVNKILSY